MHGHEKVTSSRRLAVVCRFLGERSAKREPTPLPVAEGPEQPVVRSTKRRIVVETMASGEGTRDSGGKKGAFASLQKTPKNGKPMEKETPEKEEGVRKSRRLNPECSGGMLDTILGTLEMKSSNASCLRQDVCAQKKQAVVVDLTTSMGKKVGKLKRWGDHSFFSLSDLPKVATFLRDLSDSLPGYTFAYAH